MHNYLQKLIENKKREVSVLKEQVAAHPNGPLAKFLRSQTSKKSTSLFKERLKTPGALIAEVKRQSPSKKNMATIEDPVKLAEKYVKGGAVAVSVLTDEMGFGGSLQDLKCISEALREQAIPILRKDFIIDPIQIAESMMIGAQAVLLIVAALGERTNDLLNLTRLMGIEALVEVNNPEELQIAVSAGAEIIAVNNRDLTTFEVDPGRALRLKPAFPDSVVSIAASGMETPDAAAAYIKAGYDAVLVGEALVKSGDAAAFIRRYRKLVGVVT